MLREIADQYGGVTVSFPQSGIKSSKVTLKGAKDCVEGAKRRIAEIVADLVSGILYEVTVNREIFTSLNFQYMGSTAFH